MTGHGCNYVALYLERFLDEGVREGIDLEQVSAHVGTCPRCYARLSQFFRTIEIPESSYLRETLDELALALFNLGKAIIRERPAQGPDDSTENVHITEPGEGSARDNVQAGVEMIEDAEDFAGSTRVGGMDLDAVRELLEDAEGSRRMKIDLALAVFRPITALDSRYLFKAWNWIGVLHYQKKEFDEAEAAFLKVLAAPDGAVETRAWTHCNLAYIFKHRGNLDRAIRSAERSVALAGVDGQDPYFGHFAALYCFLLRGADADLDRAGEHLESVLAMDHGRERLRSDFLMDSNQPMLAAFRASPLVARCPDLV